MPLLNQSIREKTDETTALQAELQDCRGKIIDLQHKLDEAVLINRELDTELERVVKVVEEARSLSTPAPVTPGPDDNPEASPRPKSATALLGLLENSLVTWKHKVMVFYARSHSSIAHSFCYSG